MRRIAFLTMENPAGFFTYDHLAAPPLAERGWEVVETPWSRPGIDWAAFAAVVIRSPWDYQQRSGEFLRVLEEVDASPARLLNSLDIVRWNIRKTYLRELQLAGVRIVPTLWPERLTPSQLEAAISEFSSGGFRAGGLVVKPIVGANADDTFRLPTESLERSAAPALALFSDRPCLLQPFVESVVDPGEFSLFYFGGEYSHAILKTPAAGDFRVQEEHGGAIRAVSPDDSLLGSLRGAGAAAMAALPFPTLYARVDLVLLAGGGPAVMEVELIEPSLYFPYDEASPERFAAALDSILRTDV